jgi:spore maturation protein SpmB
MNKSLADVFVDGARKGWNIGVNSIIPNVLMAYALIQVLKVTGILDLLGNLFAPVMAVFGLPGAAVMVLAGAWLSMAGGMGVAVSLYATGTLNAVQLTILLPAIFLMGAQLQYMGRMLGTAGIKTRFYPVLFAISIINAVVSMLIMRIFV